MTTHKVKHSTEKMFLFNSSNIIALYGSEFVCNVLRWPHNDAKFLYLLWVNNVFCRSFSIFTLFPLFVCIHAHSHTNFRHNVQVLTVCNIQVHTCIPYRMAFVLTMHRKSATNILNKNCTQTHTKKSSTVEFRITTVNRFVCALKLFKTETILKWTSHGY